MTGFFSPRALRVRAAAALCVAGGLVAACATPTPYGPAERSGGYGYSEQTIEDDRYRVTFRANAAGADDAYDFALLRAAELTLNAGYDWFEVVRRGREQEGGYQSGSGVSVGLGGSSGSRGSSLGVGVGLNFPLGGGATGSAETAFIEFVARDGEAPDEANAYDARAITTRLRPTTR